MKTLLTTALVTMLITFATGALALGPLDASAELGIYSKYVWRGMIVTDDPVLQPELSASFLGFGLGLWGNIDTKDVDDFNDTAWKFNEIDYTLSYGMSLPFLEFGAGLIHYSFPNTDVDGTTELYLAAQANVILSPRLAVYQDIDQVKGAYWEAGAGHSVALSPSMNLDLGASLGLGSEAYMLGYFGMMPDLETLTEGIPYTSATMSNFLFTAEVPFHPIPFVTITPSVAYSTLLGDAKDSVYYSEIGTDAFYFGLSGAVSF